MAKLASDSVSGKFGHFSRVERSKRFGGKSGPGFWRGRQNQLKILADQGRLKLGAWISPARGLKISVEILCQGGDLKTVPKALAGKRGKLDL